jgi:hypothetical protein
MSTDQRNGATAAPDQNERALLEAAIALARLISDGHLTIMRFTTNWRVGFFTADHRAENSALSEGATLAEALCNAIKDVTAAYQNLRALRERAWYDDLKRNTGLAPKVPAHLTEAISKYPSIIAQARPRPVDDFEVGRVVDAAYGMPTQLSGRTE